MPADRPHRADGHNLYVIFQPHLFSRTRELRGVRPESCRWPIAPTCWISTRLAADPLRA